MQALYHSIFRFALTLTAIITGSVAAPALVRAESETVYFGIYTAVKPTEQIAKFTPVAKALAAAMSESLKRPVEVKFKVAATYQEGLKDIVEGKVDFSRLGPATYIEATNANPKLSLLAIESKGGSTTDFGVICIKDDSPVSAVTDLKGKKFAFGDEASTIGRYLSQQYLLKHGIKAGDLAGFEYLGRHDAVAAAVGAGRFDAGAVKEETYKKLKASGTPLKELARFPNASQAWVAKSDLNPEVLDALKAGLLGLEDKAALKAIDADQIVQGSEEDFKLVREAINTNESFFR
ncbi:MAG: PhnD/SsuA/transferrin family substrate-binding protein [Deltaproteobacteria bacterium]|nr:PhnD/SsuA/transferrin family substrate-binding protein [Deltaproteobacteria bacterium]